MKFVKRCSVLGLLIASTLLTSEAALAQTDGAAAKDLIVKVTTEGGLDVLGRFDATRMVVARLQSAGMKVSLFINPDLKQVEAAAEACADMIELHTGCFSNAQGDLVKGQVERLAAAAKEGHLSGMQVNAGHGINYNNITQLFEVPHLAELNIGHSIIARSTRIGLTAAVREMKELMAGYPG